VETTTSTFRGVVHGNMIALTEDAGLPDGQEVAVTVRAVAKESSLPPGEGLRQSFGAWEADGEDLDQFLDWNRQQRKIGRRELEP
jgi:hypothetical protein